MKKKSNIIVCIFIISVCLLVLFINTKRSIDIKVGLVTDLSGKNSGLGISARNGLKMAIDELSLDKKYNITLVSRDHEGSTSICFDKTKELVVEGVDVIIAPVVSSMAQSVIDGTEGSGVLIIGPTISTTTLSKIDDNFLRTSATSSVQGQYIATEITKDGHSKVVIIVDEKNSAYTFGVAEGFSETFNGKDHNEVETIIYKGNHEFSGIVDKIKQADPDAIFFIANGLDSGKIAQMYGLNNPMPALYGSSWVKVSDVAKYGGKTVEGMILGYLLL